MHDHTKAGMDIAAGMVSIATIFSWLPAAAAGLSIVWTALRIYEWIRDKRWKSKQ